MTAVSLGLTRTVLGGDSYRTLAEQGYRWVVVNGPYACITEQNVERITTHHTDATDWMYPVFGLQGASWFLGVSEWLFGGLIFAGFWNKPLGILGALGSCVTFIMTITIIPFMPDGWAASAGGFPAMQGNVAFLMKDVVLFAVSFYLLKQDVARVSLSQSARASCDLSGK